MRMMLLLGMFLLSGCVATISPVLTTQTITANKESCKNDGWKSLRKSSGESFKNQGDCVSYFASGK